MNLIHSIKSRVQHFDTTKPIHTFNRTSSELCGVVFVLVGVQDGVLNTTLPLAQKAATTHNAHFIGMISGLLQFLVKDVPQKDIKDYTRALSEEIARSAGEHVLVVWTVQRCSHGCWGDDNAVSYGALVPNFCDIMVVLGSAKLGEVREV